MTDLSLYYTDIDWSVVTSITYVTCLSYVAEYKTQSQSSGFSVRYCQPTLSLSQVTRKAPRLWNYRYHEIKNFYYEETYNVLTLQSNLGKLRVLLLIKEAKQQNILFSLKRSHTLENPYNKQPTSIEDFFIGINKFYTLSRSHT